jgi:hypothetical protein
MNRGMQPSRIAASWIAMTATACAACWPAAVQPVVAPTATPATVAAPTATPATVAAPTATPATVAAPTATPATVAAPPTLAAHSTPAGSTAPPLSTTVVTLAPTVPAGPSREGTCWTRSIAAPRDGAWRCKMGNQIADPCFSLPSRQTVVVCLPDPVTGDPGFALQLTTPLPTGLPAPSVPPAPWLIRLADGQTCRPFTGTVPVVAGEPARWYCGDPASPVHRGGGLVTKIDDRASPWMATWYPASAGGAPSDPPKPEARTTLIPVTNAWE